MSGFAEALKRGLDVHKRAEEARKEMDEVLDAASRDVSSVVQVEVSFQFEILERPARAPSVSETIGLVSAPREKYQALTVRRPDAARQVLAEARFAALGYPVNLRWEGEFRIADDREAFEAVIQDLLGDGVTAARIEALARGK